MTYHGYIVWKQKYVRYCNNIAITSLLISLTQFTRYRKKNLHLQTAMLINPPENVWWIRTNLYPCYKLDYLCVRLLSQLTFWTHDIYTLFTSITFDLILLISRLYWQIPFALRASLISYMCDNQSRSHYSLVQSIEFGTTHSQPER